MKLRGKKAMIGELLGQPVLSHVCLGLGSMAARRLTILAYHRVLELGDERAYVADPELVSASLADFEDQMRFVKRHFNPISFTQLIEAIDSGARLPARSVIITFDDGHLDNYTNAFPILARLGVPATIFVSTDYIASGRQFWFDRVASLTMAARAGTYAIDTAGLQLRLDDEASRREACGGLLQWLKTLENGARLLALEEIDARFDPEGRYREPPRAAFSWDEAREMSGRGIEIASHTVSHPILSKLDDAALRAELSESRAAIARHVGRDVPVIAYPIGKRGAYDDRVMATSKACGYRLGVSYESGVNDAADLQLFELQRLAVERYTTRAFFRSMMSLPEVFA